MLDKTNKMTYVPAEGSGQSAFAKTDLSLQCVPEERKHWSGTKLAIESTVQALM